jgi:hypothetical protein
MPPPSPRLHPLEDYLDAGWNASRAGAVSPNIILSTDDGRVIEVRAVVMRS